MTDKALDAVMAAEEEAARIRREGDANAEAMRQDAAKQAEKLRAQAAEEAVKVRTEILARADQAMYEDKKRKKKPSRA